MTPDCGTGLAGRVAIVTGAGQGIGRAFAHALANSGAIPVIAELNAERGQAVAAEIKAASAGADADVLAVATDVSDPQSVASMVSKVEAAFGRIDILVNNAGIFSTIKTRPFYEIPLEEWEQVLRVNVTGPFLCARAVVPAMRRAGWGRIINMSSGAVTLGRPNYLHYIASKSALVGMSRSMARELGPHGITVNAIMPGATFTEVPRETVTPQQKEVIIRMQCIPRAETPADLVGALLFLCSDASAFVTGQALTVDGGATHP